LHQNHTDYGVGFRVCNGNHAPVKQSKCDKAFFAIIETVIENCNRPTIKHSFDSDEIKSVFGNVRLTFGFIPFKVYERKCNDKM